MISACFIIIQCPPIGNDRQSLITYWLYRLHRVQTILDRFQAKSQTDTQAGVLWNQYTDSIRGENLYTKWRQIPDKISFKMMQNAYFTYLVGLIGLHEAWTFYANRSSGNTHPLKSWQELTVDVTSPKKSNIYLCAVMNHDTIKCTVPNSNTRTTQSKHTHTKNVIPPCLA